MRRYIQIVENAQPSVPEWYLRGQPVNIRDARWKAEEFVEGQEWDYDWRLCMVPAELVVNPKFTPMGRTAEDAEQRARAIHDWVATHGGDFATALMQEPPLWLLTSSGKLKLFDGYHRTNLAAQAGLREIPALVALGDPDPTAW